jgi:Right handed beta helix region
LESTSSFSNCIITGNHATVSSGGVNLYKSHATFTNCTFTNNSTESTHDGSTLDLHSSSPIITNSILGNTSDGFHISYNPSTPIITYSQTPIGIIGEGNIHSSPLFVDPENNDFSLSPGSPCIDAGTRDYAPATDITGMGRPQGGFVDMGAYEKMIGGGVFLSN